MFYVTQNGVNAKHNSSHKKQAIKQLHQLKSSSSSWNAMVKKQKKIMFGL